MTSSPSRLLLDSEHSSNHCLLRRDRAPSALVSAFYFVFSFLELLGQLYHIMTSAFGMTADPALARYIRQMPPVVMSCATNTAYLEAC
jgi:hypothetical protein